MNQVLIIGKPNSGKSLLFNRLTGLRQKVANFPGVTVAVKSGRSGNVLFTDFPGMYSFSPITKDEEIAVEHFERVLEDSSVKAILCTLDATRLERSLAMGLQVQYRASLAGKPIIFALNMMDEIKGQGLSIDIPQLEKELGSPIFGVSARKKWGMKELKTAIEQVTQDPDPYLAEKDQLTKPAYWMRKSRQLSQCYGPSADIILKRQNFLDRFFLSGIFGGVAFFAIMAFLFQAIFTWATPLMDFVEISISWLGLQVITPLPKGVVADFIDQALFGGVGAFLVFVPQIFVLTFIIGILEDSGYLARAAIICHKPLSFFGLSGKSFVPMLSGHACAIPAILAARNIDSPKKRMLTIMAIPLMACSARLPVYSLLIAALIPATTFMSGLIGYRGLAFFGLYFFGIMMGLLISGLLSRTLYQKESDTPFVLELPPYRIPHWKPLVQKSLQDSWTFVAKAGFMIFSVSVIVWLLGYFPNGTGSLDTSYLAIIGQWIEPIFRPLGLSWKYGVAILASFLAREVFVGTLGTLFEIAEPEANLSRLSDKIQTSGFEPASGFALLVFYAIALQCASTLAIIKSETGSYKIPLLLLIGYGILAYLFAATAYFAFSYFT